MIIKCTRCCDEKVVKNGKAPSGSQKYKCKTCNYAFVLKPKNAPISEEKKALVDRLLKEKLSLAGIARAAKVGKTWLQDYVNKKYNNISKNIEYAQGCHGLILECDELWSFCGKRSNKLWIWVALDRYTKAVIGLWIGDRSHESAQKLWDRLPKFCQDNATMYTDFWESYKAIFPQKQLQQCGKDQGQTNHVERFNNTLRQRVSRLVRKTLSFSKKIINHLGAIWDFVHHYNSDIYRRISSLSQNAL